MANSGEEVTFADNACVTVTQTHSYEVRLEGQGAVRNTDAAHLAPFTDETTEAAANGAGDEAAGRDAGKGPGINEEGGKAAAGGNPATTVGRSAALSAAAALIPDSLMAKKSDTDKDNDRYASLGFFSFWTG